MLNRQSYQVNTDTGTWSRVGPSFMGGVMQIGWSPSTGDTGGDLAISLLPAGDGDTGAGWVIYDNNDCLGADFLQSLTKSAVHANGSDTGSGGAQVPVVSAGDRLKVKVTPGGAAVVGTLNIWTYEG